MSLKPIPLFYWSERKFTFKEKENYGDLLSKYLVERISGRTVKFVHPKKQAWYKLEKKNYLAIGSIIHHATKDSVVWGSGIIDRKQNIAPADFRAVRGPQTRKILLNSGHECPEVFGDPALLLPEYYAPQEEKKYPMGIIPHYHDYQEIAELYKNEKEIKVVDLMTMDVEKVTREILQCEKIVSSSLHGLIVAHAYEIPAIWVEFSKKLFGDGIKFRDYMESVKVPYYQTEFIQNKIQTENMLQYFETYPALPDKDLILKLQEDLLKNCPFLVE